MSATHMKKRDLLNALAEADAAHDCPAALFCFREDCDGQLVIRCAGCREPSPIWRGDHR